MYRANPFYPYKFQPLYSIFPSNWELSISHSRATIHLAFGTKCPKVRKKPGSGTAPLPSKSQLHQRGELFQQIGQRAPQRGVVPLEGHHHMEMDGAAAAEASPHGRTRPAAPGKQTLSPHSTQNPGKTMSAVQPRGHGPRPPISPLPELGHPSAAFSVYMVLKSVSGKIMPLSEQSESLLRRRNTPYLRTVKPCQNRQSQCRLPHFLESQIFLFFIKPFLPLKDRER